jgi:hypothetical protein
MRRWTSLFAGLAACKGCQDAPPVAPNVLDPMPTDAVGVWVGSASGVGSVDVPVFAVNAWGAPVAADTIALSSDGTLSQGTLSPDAGGWAFASVSGAEGAYTVTATVGSVAADGSAFVVGTLPGDVELPAIDAGGEPTILAAAGEGVAWAMGGQVWWSAATGGARARVLDMGEEVAGMVRVQADSDGVDDLLVWSTAAVLILRGRAGGGLGWGAGFVVPDGYSVSFATMFDFDLDAVNDLVVAVAAGETTWTVVAPGDGVWGYAQVDGLGSSYGIGGVTGQDYDGDGECELGILTEDGLLQRFARYDGEWLVASNTEFNLGVGGTGTRVEGADFDGDGVEEVFVAGPRLDGSGWSAWVVAAAATSPTQYQLFSDSAAPEHLAVDLRELSGDGLMDVGLLAGDRFLRMSWAGESISLTAVTDLPEGQALATGEFLGDAVPDIAVGGASIRVFAGARDEDDDTTEEDESIPWRIATPGTLLYSAKAAVAPAFGDFNEDGIVDLVSLQTQDDGSITLQAYYGQVETSSSAASIRTAGAVTLATSGTPRDVALCDGLAYAIVDDASGVSWLYRYEVSSLAALTERYAALTVGGTLLACGALDGSEVAVAASDGSLTYYAEAEVVTAPGSGQMYDLAAGDDDGDGVDSVFGCFDEGCTVAAGDLDGDGFDDVVTSDAAGIAVTTADDAFVIGDSGAVSLSDADGDGDLDVVVGNDARYAVWRLVGGEFAPAFARHAYRPAEDRVYLGDLDGNGVPDALWTADLADEDLAGGIIYGEAPDTATE